jgi:uncharacterized protein Veg
LTKSKIQKQLGRFKEIEIEGLLIEDFGKMFVDSFNKAVELNLFSHELYQEGYQSEIRLESTFEGFADKLTSKRRISYQYATVEAGFPQLVTLAHVYFKAPLFPNQWRTWAISPII